jgi:LytS/YehU family sensor histidine kinase
MLQMLIENAIKHGVDTIEGGGRLDVTAAEHDATLVFTISNDLPAHSANPSTTSKTNETTNMGIGLENIRQRLLLLYGQQASLYISNHQSERAVPQFVVTLTIPKEFNR